MTREDGDEQAESRPSLPPSLPSFLVLLCGGVGVGVDVGDRITLHLSRLLLFALRKNSFLLERTCFVFENFLPQGKCDESDLVTQRVPLGS